MDSQGPQPLGQKTTATKMLHAASCRTRCVERDPSSPCRLAPETPTCGRPPTQKKAFQTACRLQTCAERSRACMCLYLCIASSRRPNDSPTGRQNECANGKQPRVLETWATLLLTRARGVIATKGLIRRRCSSAARWCSIVHAPTVSVGRNLAAFGQPRQTQATLGRVWSNLDQLWPLLTNICQLSAESGCRRITHTPTCSGGHASRSCLASLERLSEDLRGEEQFFEQV